MVPASTGAAAPRPGPPTLLQRLALRVLALAGWRLDVAWPPVSKCVIVVAPHTSNWDFVVGYLAKMAVGIPVQWAGKDEIFRGPFAAMFRRMGGIPVNRREHTGLIRQLVREFDGRPWMWLAIAPEGTRKRTDHWKSGFYHLALEAKVPVGLAFIDFGERVVGLTDYVTLSGDEERDLGRLRAFYAGKVGRHPEQASDIRFIHERTR